MDKIYRILSSIHIKSHCDEVYLLHLKGARHGQLFQETNEQGACVGRETSSNAVRELLDVDFTVWVNDGRHSSSSLSVGHFYSIHYTIVQFNYVAYHGLHLGCGDIFSPPPERVSCSVLEVIIAENIGSQDVTGIKIVVTLSEDVVEDFLL